MPRRLMTNGMDCSYEFIGNRMFVHSEDSPQNTPHMCSLVLNDVFIESKYNLLAKCPFSSNLYFSWEVVSDPFIANIYICEYHDGEFVDVVKHVVDSKMECISDIYCLNDRFAVFQGYIDMRICDMYTGLMGELINYTCTFFKHYETVYCLDGDLLMHAITLEDGVPKLNATHVLSNLIIEHLDRTPGHERIIVLHEDGYAAIRVVDEEIFRDPLDNFEGKSRKNFFLHNDCTVVYEDYDQFYVDELPDASCLRMDSILEIDNELYCFSCGKYHYFSVAKKLAPKIRFSVGSSDYLKIYKYKLPKISNRAYIVIFDFFDNKVLALTHGVKGTFFAELRHFYEHGKIHTAVVTREVNSGHKCCIYTENHKEWEKFDLTKLDLNSRYVCNINTNGNILIVNGEEVDGVVDVVRYKLMNDHVWVMTGQTMIVYDLKNKETCGSVQINRQLNGIRLTANPFGFQLTVRALWQKKHLLFYLIDDELKYIEIGERPLPTFIADGVLLLENSIFILSDGFLCKKLEIPTCTWDKHGLVIPNSGVLHRINHHMSDFTVQLEEITFSESFDEYTLILRTIDIREFLCSASIEFHSVFDETSTALKYV
ncbi:hypothetical protein PCE1_001252 [Barthelona sp. PCE]